MSKPRISILDPRFKYRDSAHTDVSRTFRRHRLLQRLQEQKHGQAITSVVQLTTRKKSHGC